MADAIAARSGQTDVAAAGTEVVLGNGRVNGPIAIRAKAGNAGLVYVGLHSDGTLSSTTGYELSAGDQIILEYIGDLNNLYVDAATNGDDVCWLCLGKLE